MPRKSNAEIYRAKQLKAQKPKPRRTEDENGLPSWPVEQWFGSLPICYTWPAKKA